MLTLCTVNHRPQTRITAFSCPAGAEIWFFKLKHFRSGRGGSALGRVSGQRTDNKNWLEDCYWPRRHQEQPSGSQAVTGLEDTQPSYHTQRVRSLRSENHIRVLALNNQFSMWNQSNNITNENFDQNNLQRNNYQDFPTQNIIEEGEGIIEKISSPRNSQQELKFKSKLPFSPKSIRKSYK